MFKKVKSAGGISTDKSYGWNEMKGKGWKYSADENGEEVWVREEKNNVFLATVESPRGKVKKIKKCP